MIRSLVVPGAAILALLAGAPPLAGQDVTLRGFVSGSFVHQDAIFAPGNGHRGLWVTDDAVSSFHLWDVRSTRLALEVSGPEVVARWRVAGLVEVDFHGAFAAGRPFGDEQPQIRLRLAYADLTDGRTTLRIGQQWAQTLGHIPVSTTWTGFLPGWGTGGVIGWRFPGASLAHRLTGDDAPTAATLRIAVLRGSWSGPGPDGPALETLPPGAAAYGSPQLQARLDLDGELADGSWNVHLTGHYDRKDFEAAGVEPPAGVAGTLTSWAAQAGARVEGGPVTAQGGLYVGRAMGHHFAHFARLGDISGWGGWGQLGLRLAPRWSMWTMVGLDDPDAADMAAAGGDQARGLLVLPMLRFQAGPYQLGLEWFHNRVATTDDSRAGNQVAASMRFSF